MIIEYLGNITHKSPENKYGIKIAGTTLLWIDGQKN